MVIKKNIVLNGVKDVSKKAILAIEYDNDVLSGNVRLFNFSSQPKGIISLGICFNGQVLKVGLTRVSNTLYSFTSRSTFLPEKFSCAIVNFNGGDVFPLLFGNSEGCSESEELFDNIISEISQSNSAEEIEEVLDKYEIDFDEKEKEEIEDVISQNLTQEDIKLCQHDCESCMYKNFYYSHLQEKEDLNEDKKFYKEIEGQITELFSNNPCEEYLQELLPNSKWVKVDVENSGDYYVLGLIYEEDNLKYICYGVPGVYQKEPPRELSGYPIWFPLEASKPQGFGYWLSYQDADSGESIKAIVE